MIMMIYLEIIQIFHVKYQLLKRNQKNNHKLINNNFKLYVIKNKLILYVVQLNQLILNKYLYYII